MYKVQVLLSTYNGEKYIREQLDSILAQKDVEVSVLIRDDGSTDSTIDIINDYCSKNSDIKLIKGSNMGACKSYFELFKKADMGYDYYALSDQDDYWYEDKLTVACHKLTSTDNKENKPLLYCCEADITDENLNSSGKDTTAEEAKTSFPVKKPGFGNALIENIARGGSVVFNPTLLGLVRIDAPADCYMHDWWLYLLATCFGKVIHDNKAYYKYRQHKDNVLGASTSKLGIIKRRLSQSKTNKEHVSKQAIAFGKLYEIPEKKKIQLDVIAGYKNSFKQRVRGLSGKYLYRQSKSDNIIFRILFLTNHL
ncbi:MAG: glycosyltransferase family 2 protein [Lachnospiraceae bacterium]|nr:glycosyltransferase family 2 protein [Lachnospiraceae bacterium]